MSYIFGHNDAIKYDEWFQHQANQFSINLENELMFKLVQPVRGESVLGIGCGTGRRLFRFLEKGLEVTGLDPSPYMLEIAKKNLGNKVDLHQCHAEDMPFDDNSFNIAVIITSLEFVKNVDKAIIEACRVAKDRLFIGIWNKFAIRDIRRYINGMLTEDAYNNINFISIFELKNKIKGFAGNVPVSWKTVGQFGGGSGSFGQKVEQSNFLMSCPFGCFVGMNITLEPRFRTRTLNLKINKTNEAFAGAV